MPSFDTKKGLRFRITLGTGKFTDAGHDQITLEGYRATVDIDKAGGMQMGTLRARIYGVKQSDMNACTTLQWKPGTFQPNTVEVWALVGNVETLIFAGNIVNAWGDYGSMPEVFLMIQAQAAYFNQMQSAKPRSYKGSVDVSSIMSAIAADMGYSFENNGVTARLADVYLSNTNLEQAKALAEAAGIDLYVDDKTIAIAPRYAGRGKAVPVVSRESGLIGYPSFDGVCVNFQTLFNPALTFGGLVKLETEIPTAAGEWVIAGIAYRLEAEKPGGAWVAQIRGNQSGLAISRQ